MPAYRQAGFKLSIIFNLNLTTRPHDAPARLPSGGRGRAGSTAIPTEGG